MLFASRTDPCAHRRSPWQQFSPHAKIATASASQGVAREKPWQFLRGGENCCHGDRLGTQGSVQLANTTIRVWVYLFVASALHAFWQYIGQQKQRFTAKLSYSRAAAHSAGGSAAARAACAWCNFDLGVQRSGLRLTRLFIFACFGCSN